LFSTRPPQPLPSWLVQAGSTTPTCVPAPAALEARVGRTCSQPAALRRVARGRWRTQLATRPCSSARASEIEGIIGAQQHERWLVRAFAPLPPPRLVPLGARHPRLLAARAPLLPPRPALRRLGEGGLRLAGGPGCSTASPSGVRRTTWSPTAIPVCWPVG